MPIIESQIKSNVSYIDDAERFLHVEPSSISWHNIEVFSKPQKSFFKQSKPQVQIVKNVSGYLKPGSTLAIMGSSGAGKTTLLNVLTARNLCNFEVSGVVKINGQNADVATLTSFTAYVQQEDMFLPKLTVREQLVFQALVRMDPNLSINVKASRIQQVMTELSLLKCAETQVGGVGAFKGISGGEMKRLAFAIETLTNPSIMFCDEPTSGLDAFMAESLVSMIRRMAKKGRTIICTIHQPATDVFRMFDYLLLLADGRVAYMGPLEETVSYFSKLGFRCPNNYNPADYLIKELAIIPGKEFESRNKIDMICEYYKAKNPHTNLRKESSFLDQKVNYRFKASMKQQFKALAWRSYICTLREPMLAYIRLLQSLFISIMLGSIYFHQVYNNRGVLNLNAALFLILVNMTTQNVLAVINTFCKEMPIFFREYANGMYRVFPYFACKNLSEFPIFVLIPIIFTSIYYFMVGFIPQMHKFLFAVLVAILVSTCSVAFGYLMSCACKKTDIALAIAPPILSPLQLFGGFYINSKSIPLHFVWARYASWFYYAFELLIINQWIDYGPIDCFGSDLISDDDNNNNSTDTTLTFTTELSNLLPPLLTPTVNDDHQAIALRHSQSSSSTSEASFCLESGKAVVDFLDFKQENIFINLGSLVLINFVLRALGVFALWIQARER